MLSIRLVVLLLVIACNKQYENKPKKNTDTHIYSEYFPCNSISGYCQSAKRDDGRIVVCPISNKFMELERNIKYIVTVFSSRRFNCKEEWNLI